MEHKRVLFRVDASEKMGYGHFSRCLTLAKILQSRGVAISFATRRLPPDLLNSLIQHGIQAVLLPGDPNEPCQNAEDAHHTGLHIKSETVDYDWLVVDHFELDALWESKFSDFTLKLFVIEDLTHRKHHCHVLLNQTWGVQPSIYTGLVNANTQLLLGSHYVLLRPEFSEYHATCSRIKNFITPKVHLFMGSTDPLNCTYRFTKMLLEHFSDISLVVMTAATQSPIKWTQLKRRYANRLTQMDQCENMANLLSKCDIAFGAPGMTTWERASLGLPGIYVSTHPTQEPILITLQAEGFCHHLGRAQDLTEKAFVDKCKSILMDAEALLAMGKKGYDAIDGRGACRVADCIMGQ